MNGTDIIGGVPYVKTYIALDTQSRKIFENGLLIFFLFPWRGLVYVIESYNETSLIATGVIIVQQTPRLGVSDVQITTGFGRKSCDDLSRNGAPAFLASVLERVPDTRLGWVH